MIGGLKNSHSSLAKYQAQRWTDKMVEKRLEEAAETLRRLPAPKVQGYVSCWPPIIQEFWESYGWDLPRVRLGPPTGDAIDRMDECLCWLRWLEPIEAKIVWARACHTNYKLVGQHFGVHRSTAWRYRKVAIGKILSFLKAEHN